MTDRSAGPAGRGEHEAPEVDTPTGIRNVVVVGHTGAGKTTLVEALLAASGTVKRQGRIEDGTTVCDFDDVEHRQQRSVGLALAPLTIGDIKVNLLDTPGYADFVGDLRAGLRAADAALFAVSAADGIDGSTRLLWDECAAVGMPRAVVVTKLDSSRADFDEMVAMSRRVFGDGVQPLYLPLLTDDERLGGVLGLLSQRVFDYSSGERIEREPEREHVELIENARNELIEGVIAESEDETLMDRYLAGEPIDTAVLVADLETAVARGRFHPVLPIAAHGSDEPGARVGTIEILELITKAFPSPPSAKCPRCGRRAARRARRCPAIPRRRWPPRSSRRRPIPTSAGSAWCGCSRAR